MTEAERPSAWETAREEDIYYCYRLLLNREPDPEGLKNHTCALKTGTTVRSLVSTFLNSPEFLKARMAEEAAREQPSLVDAGRFHIYLSDLDSPVARAIVQTRVYEPHITSALESILKPGMVFVDVGANVGFLSLLAARLVGTSGKVHAFEPNQYFCKLLHLSAQKNGFDNIEIYPMAVADGRKSVLYYKGCGNGRIAKVNVDLESGPSKFLVPAWALDDALGREASIDVIKMDIEGAEYLAYQGASRIIGLHRPTIITELSAMLPRVSGVPMKDYLEALINEQYELSILELDGSLSRCGRDIEAVLRRFDDREIGHLDLMAMPG